MARLVLVQGDESSAGISREEAVFGFTPESSEAPEGCRDAFDVLVTTDVLAEGMNLQQCRNIINYDLPWNPMRLVQRHGRIDRIGSPHEEVFMRCFFPDARLEVLLELEDKIRNKVAQAAATVGLEHEVIPGAATSEQVFAETREEIEKLRRRTLSFLSWVERWAACSRAKRTGKSLEKALSDSRVRSKNWRGGRDWNAG